MYWLESNSPPTAAACRLSFSVSLTAVTALHLCILLFNLVSPSIYFLEFFPLQVWKNGKRSDLGNYRGFSEEQRASSLSLPPNIAESQFSELATYFSC
ncbi:hypothetical protein Ancab_008022 [Ancistrocladus abbreviatus]